MTPLPRTSPPSPLRAVTHDGLDQAAPWFGVKFKSPSKSVPLFRARVREIISALEDSAEGRLERLSAAVEGWHEELRASVDVTAGPRWWPPEDAQRLFAALSIITDLARQEWSIELAPRGAELRLTPPAAGGADAPGEKQRIRQQELLKRAEQLSKPAAREFVQGMERRRLHGKAFVSIFSLMHDGRELAERIEALHGLVDFERRGALSRLVQPYLQFVDEEARCEFTGLRLMEIWRYFRHTWANQYVSVPGRTMQVLVRDRAAPLHPVIGIVALSSPVLQIRERDLSIGWHPERFIATTRAAPSDRVARWIASTVDGALDELYRKDFLEEKVFSLPDLQAPSDALLDALDALGFEERKLHERQMSSKEYKQQVRSPNWVERARTHLFRSKRAYAFQELLSARRTIRQYLGARPSKAQLAALLDDPAGVDAVTRILRKAKADRVGIVMADISVCGAVPPYNVLLGGKLVAMLATSPEVVAEYRRRYGKAVSEIASGMTGREVIRRPDLAFLSTTSLYGGSSQYNRIAIPCDRLGGAKGALVRYEETGRSEAYGTSHFSDETVEALEVLCGQEGNGLRVNSVFGEGQSPKMRKIRQGLEKIGFPSDPLLRHGRRRVVYCVPLIRNVRDFLIGLDSKPDYLVPQEHPRDATDAIARWWQERWLSGRSLRPESMAALREHTLVYPIRHGARVSLPTGSQRGLFEEDA